MKTNEFESNEANGATPVFVKSAQDQRRLYDKDLDRDLGAMEQAAAMLAALEADSDVMPDVLPDILSKIEQDEQCFADVELEDFRSGNWDRHGDRIDFKTLWQDGTILIRCEPGAVEAQHAQPNDAAEHIIVIAGDLRVGNRIFGTGDYLSLPAGSTHQRMWSETGCILFTQYI
jgi:anti-sigma factor ChrR (cupin superfamily)